MSHNGEQPESEEHSSATEGKPHIAMADCLAAHRGEQHLIVLHDFPDPDAISTAYAHKLISAEFEIEADIIYSGTISHQQNIALVRLLRIDLLSYKPSFDFAKYDAAIFVDNQGATSEEIVQALQEAEVPTLMVIDHHELQELLTPEFSDIRHTGSTATIYAEYLEQGIMKMEKTQPQSSMATALMLGLLTDTNNLINANYEDFQAAAYLSQYSDADLLRQIMTQSRSKQVMEVIRRALGERITVENFSIAGIGYLRADDRDAIPQAADFLLTEENVHTAVVYGIVLYDDEEALIGSFRTSKITTDPDDFIKTTFGQTEEGHYFGGGKSMAGAFKIPIGFLSGGEIDDFSDLKWQVYDMQIKSKLFNKLGVRKKED